MAEPVRTAVILAAGMGVRLQDTVKDIPKGFLPMGGRPLIERSVDLLLSRGLERIIIVTGHLAEFYKELAARRPEVATVNNPVYADSGSMYSLFCARDELDSDFLLLESDLIYEARALDALISAEPRNAILISGFTRSGDEVYVGTEEDRVRRMSKQKEELGHIEGELVGISRIGSPMFDAMNEFAAAHFTHNLKLEYEACINGVAGEIPVGFCKVEDLIWAEIDDASHLRRVQETILPRLSALEGDPS